MFRDSHEYPGILEANTMASAVYVAGLRARGPDEIILQSWQR